MLFVWAKALHLIFMVTWFAGLFYLPRLYVYHCMTRDALSIDRFQTMERKLFYGIMTPGCVLTLVFGGISLAARGWAYYQGALWMHLKLGCILALLAYHIYCGKLLLDFKYGRNRRSHIWYRWFNEVPVLFLVAIVIFAVVRPF